MNDFMSLGVHRLWKDHLVNNVLSLPASVAANPTASSSSSSSYAHLDVAGGTGDISFRVFSLLQSRIPSLSSFSPSSSSSPAATVTVCDINPAMLKVGEERAVAQFGEGMVARMSAFGGASESSPSKPVRFCVGNAECLPFPPSTFDRYTIAFGLRNVTDPSKALKDALRVLKPGGRIHVLEFSHPTNAAFKAFYDYYSINVIPKIGALVSGDEASYKYLVESIRRWDTQEVLAARLRGAGFEAVEWENLNLGIVSIHTGCKNEKGGE